MSWIISPGTNEIEYNLMISSLESIHNISVVDGGVLFDLNVIEAEEKIILAVVENKVIYPLEVLDNSQQINITLINNQVNIQMSVELAEASRAILAAKEAKDSADQANQSLLEIQRLLDVNTAPEFTYTDGLLTRVNYSNGNYKVFSYTDGILTQLDYVTSSATIRKTFTYNVDGTLKSITQNTL